MKPPARLQLRGEEEQRLIPAEQAAAQQAREPPPGLKSVRHSERPYNISPFLQDNYLLN